MKPLPMGIYKQRRALTPSYNTISTDKQLFNMRFIVQSLILCTGLSLAQYTTTPVPILKQINRHNEDGSYSYGYEAADGSYKIESKYPTGEVYGKYGFVDDTGTVREVEYGATRRGFEPAGVGINVPPSTLTENTIRGKNEPEDDGQYREDPSIYYTDPRFTNGEKYERRPPPPPPPPRQPYKQPTLRYNGPAKSEYSSYQQYEPAQRVQPEVQYPQYKRYNQPSNIDTSSYTVQYRKKK
ncbi:uncharacterized protein [Fopius arisanus]|uniref:CUPA5 protein n=1 Tax=Fopius arisanus TaxID=64838 RepID=A0A0C9R7S1_9HYME|nr:PREDICTED: uncharacterized protein LOC105270108 [Fopius arisanus]